MRCVHKIVLTLSLLILFAPLAHSQTRRTTHGTAQARTLPRPQPRYNAHWSHTFTAAGSDVAVKLGASITWHQLSWTPSGSVTTCQVQLDQSNDAIHWSPMWTPPETCTSAAGGGQSAAHNSSTGYIRLTVTVFAGTGSVLVDYFGFTSNPGGGGGGGGPVQPLTLHGNASSSPATPTYFSPGGDLGYNPASTTANPLFFVNGLHFGTPTTASLPLSPTSSPTSGQCLQYSGGFIVGGTCGGGGGGGNVNATPPLTSPFLPKATSTGGPTSTIADSLFQDQGFVAATNLRTGLYSGDTFGVGAGDPTCGSIVGCLALTEGTNPNSTLGPGTGHGWLRADLGTHTLKFGNINGDLFVPTVTNTGSAGQVPISNGNGTYTALDPQISLTPVLLFSAVDGTAGHTTLPIQNPLRSGYGTLTIIPSPTAIFTPGSCSITLYAGDSTGPYGPSTNNAPYAVINFTLTQLSGGQSYPVIPDPSTVGAGVGGNYVIAAYNCASFPGLGAQFTATLSPAMTTGPPFTCNRKYIINATGLAVTQIIPAVNNTKIYVCGWTVNTAFNTAVTVDLVQGTGTNCATGLASFSEAVILQALANNSPVGEVVNAPSNVVDATPYGSALCLRTAGTTAPPATTPISGKVWYAQF